MNRKHTSLSIKKETLAEYVTKMVNDEVEFSSVLTDDEMIDKLKEQLEKSQRQREIIMKQNETLLNLSSEYTLIRRLLMGQSIDAISEIESQSEDEINTPND